MPDHDAHIHVFQDDRTARASLDRINRAKEHRRAYVQGRAELELLLNKQAILLSEWRAEDRALRSSRARAVVCVDCGARHLEHFCCKSLEISWFPFFRNFMSAAVMLCL